MCSEALGEHPGVVVAHVDVELGEGLALIAG